MQTPNPTATMSDSPYAGLSASTPGPWHVIPSHDQARVMIGRFPAYDTNPIAVFSLICMRESKEFKANARLIAAAPMLLQEVAALQATNAALRAALEAAVARVELANSEGNPILSAWLPDARAALAGQGVQS